MIHRLIYAAAGLLVCLGVPALILMSAEASSQMVGGNSLSSVCVRVGGIGVVINGAAYCRLRDGRAVDQRLFSLGRRGRAVMSNPASAYCERLGGWLDIVNEPDGQTGYCHLPNGAVVEEWTLYRGR